MSHIKLDDNNKIFVRDWGKGKPLVFISGWPFDHRCFEYQFNQLPAQGFRCLGIDMRGFGMSSRPWEGYSYDVFGEDIHQVLTKLDIKDAILIGHSMGGAIAANYVAKHNADRIAGLVLIGAAVPLWTQRPDYPFGFTTKQVDDLIDLCNKDRPQLLENFGKIFFLKENSVSPRFADWMQSMGMDSSGHATAKCLEALRNTDLRNLLAKITIPTLVLHSPHDKVCPFDLAKETCKGIKNSQLVEFKNSGHGLFYEEFEKCNQEIASFAEQIQSYQKAA